jgi:hypothetical protein
MTAAGMLCCLLAACNVNSGGLNVPRVAKRALQEDIAGRLAGAGEKPESVTCNQDLIGEVGTTVRCEVVISPSNRFEPIITVTGVDGAAIDYDMTPAVSRSQLESVVLRLVADAGTVDVKAVSCDTGIEGTVGAVAHCDVDAGNLRSRRTVEVSGVNGLMMKLEVVPLPRRMRPARPSN